MNPALHLFICITCVFTSSFYFIHTIHNNMRYLCSFSMRQLGKSDTKYSLLLPGHDSLQDLVLPLETNTDFQFYPTHRQWDLLRLWSQLGSIQLFCENTTNYKSFSVKYKHFCIFQRVWANSSDLFELFEILVSNLNNKLRTTAKHTIDV